SAPTAPAVVAGSVGSSTASISWTAPASVPANGYQLFVSTSSTAPGAGSAASVSSPSSPASLTGLSPFTVYNVWVRSACALGTSSWVGPVSFTTTCLESNIPTSENFDSYVATGGTANTGTAVPPCWSRANGTSTSSAWRVFALTGSNIGSTSGDNILASFPTVTTAKSDWALLLDTTWWVEQPTRYALKCVRQVTVQTVNVWVSMLRMLVLLPRCWLVHASSTIRHCRPPVGSPERLV
ncbi:MAG: fibronectin type III domain-containing protein, partial [Bacteroidota bacterium]